MSKTQWEIAATMQEFQRDAARERALKEDAERRNKTLQTHLDFAREKAGRLSEDVERLQGELDNAIRQASQHKSLWLKEQGKVEELQRMVRDYTEANNGLRNQIYLMQEKEKWSKHPCQS